MHTRTIATRTILGAGALAMIAGAVPLISTEPAGAARPSDSGADAITLTGIIRDFRVTHPDFETYPFDDRYRDWNGSSGGVYINMVKQELDDDGKPAFNDELLEDRTWEDIPLTSVEDFRQWFRDVPGINTSWTHDIVLERNGDVYNFSRRKPDYFFPADNLGFGNSYEGLRWAAPGVHNFHFTFELDTEFTYIDPEQRDYDLVFEFTGDDDVWVFINNRLAVDIGGVHGQAIRSVNLDSRAADLGLEPGGIYSLKLFFAERHTSESNFQIQTTLTLRTAELPGSDHLYD